MERFRPVLAVLFGVIDGSITYWLTGFLFDGEWIRIACGIAVGLLTAWVAYSRFWEE